MPARRLAIGLGLSQLVAWGALFYPFAVIQIPMGTELGLTTPELSAAFSLALGAAAAAALPVGRWLDRRHPGRLIVLGSATSAIALLAWSRIESAVALCAVMIALGVAMAATLYEPWAIIVAKAYPADRLMILATLTMVAGLASVVFVPLTAALVEVSSWRTALVVLAGTLMLTVVPAHRALVGRLPWSDRPLPPAPATALRQRGFWLLSAAFALTTLVATAIVFHLIPALVARGYSTSSAALVTSLLGLAQLPARAAFPLFAKRFGVSTLTQASFLGSALALAALATADGTALVIGAVIVQGMSMGLGSLARSLALPELYGTNQLGAVASVTSALTTASRAAGPIIAAGLLAALGDYRQALLALALLATLAALAGRASANFSASAT